MRILRILFIVFFLVILLEISYFIVISRKSERANYSTLTPTLSQQNLTNDTSKKTLTLNISSESLLDENDFGILSLIKKSDHRDFYISDEGEGVIKKTIIDKKNFISNKEGYSIEVIDNNSVVLKGVIICDETSQEIKCFKEGDNNEKIKIDCKELNSGDRVYYQSKIIIKSQNGIIKKEAPLEFILKNEKPL